MLKAALLSIFVVFLVLRNVQTHRRGFIRALCNYPNNETEKALQDHIDCQLNKTNEEALKTKRFCFQQAGLTLPITVKQAGAIYCDDSSGLESKLRRMFTCLRSTLSRSKNLTREYDKIREICIFEL